MGADTLDKETIHVPSRTEWDRTRFNHSKQKGIQFKTYGLFLEFFLIENR
jgi:hypothetical protein